MGKIHRFAVSQDYYDTGVCLYSNKNLALKEGLTVLCGCNGSGKTTLLKQLKENLRKEKIPFISFDNLCEGGDHSMSESLFNHQVSLLSAMILSSEGENIMINIGKTARKIGGKIREILQDRDKKTAEKKGTEFFIFMDAADSGLSIDNIRELKDFLAMVQEDSKKAGIIPYIVASANEYELAKGEQCLAIDTLSYTAFPDYEAYCSYIMKTRKEKDARYEREEQLKDYEEDR